MATEPHDCIVCLPWQLLAMFWQITSIPPSLRGESLKKHLLNTYFMAGTGLEDKDTRQLKHTSTLKKSMF